MTLMDASSLEMVAAAFLLFPDTGYRIQTGLRHLLHLCDSHFLLNSCHLEQIPVVGYFCIFCRVLHFLKICGEAVYL
mgnify:CR=1 FL=1